jgi:hypothetical protein
MHPDKEARMKLRADHRARAIKAMKAETTVAGRLGALLTQQQATFDQTIASARAAGVPTELCDILQEENDHYKSENADIIAAVADGTFHE